MASTRGNVGTAPATGPGSAAAGNTGNQSLARGLMILRKVADTDGELGVRELSRLLDIDRSTVSRLVNTLSAHGFLERNPVTKRYTIGPHAFQVGRNHAQINHLYEAAYDELSRLSKGNKVNAYLGVRSHDEVLYVCAVQTEQTSVLRVNTGVRGHLHSTSLGKILLAAMPDGQAVELLGRLSLSRLTPYTVTSTDQLLAQIQHVRRCGYAVADEENLVDVISVGAPVRDATGKVVAAVSSATRKTGGGQPDFLERLIRITERVAGLISARLGAPPAAPFAYLSALPDR